MLEKRSAIEDEIFLLSQRKTARAKLGDSFEMIAEGIRDILITKAQRDGVDPRVVLKEAAPAMRKTFGKDFAELPEEKLDKIEALSQRPSPPMPVTIPEKLKLSYSQIDAYRTCPLQYKYRYVFYMPEAKSVSAVFGSNVHEVLEDFFRKLQEGAQPGWKMLEELYNARWNAKGFPDKTLEKRYRDEGIRQLKTFYEKNKGELKAPLYVEEAFAVALGPHTIVGRIDRIDDLGDGEVEVIDFKTGGPKDKKFAKKSLQLSIYAIAAARAFDCTAKVLSLYYLESNEKISATRTQDELKATEQEILKTAEQIQSSAFDPTPGWICGYCDYTWICPCPDERYAKPI
jgi:DNA helicase-2/ATP-dependent DNA helicase PcrA